jgi:hypothetical protein
MQAVHHRRRERQQVGGERLHLLRHLEPRHAVAHQRLVHVQVEQLDLGVGDLRERLAVDADQLEERDEREAGLQHGGAVLEQIEILIGEALPFGGREAERAPHALDQRGLEPCAVGGVVQRVRAVRAREQLLQVAVGEPPALHRGADLTDRVAALAQPGDDPRLGDRGVGPVAVGQRDEAGADPAPQRGGRDVDPAGDVRGGDLGHEG